MFSQATVQPQVAAALSQLGNIFNSARQGSTFVYPRSRYKSRVPSKHGRPESNEGVVNELAQPQKTDVSQPEVDFEDCLSILSREENLRHLSQLVEQIHDKLENTDDTANTDSYVSAETFFENRTGFEEGLLQTSSYRQPFWPFLTVNGPKLLMSPSMATMLQQSRGFLTSISEGKGVGTSSKDRAEKKEKTADNVTKIELGEQFEKGKNTTINIHVKGEEGDGIWGKFRKSWFSTLLTMALLYSLFTLWNRSSGKIPGVGVVGLSPNNFEINPEVVSVTFKDVKGIDEVREELEELVHYLSHPEKFQKVGARLPKGVLLVGPPGVGKTLVAKAIAGEAGVPFFHASGSEFDEIFVGMGAKRVRQLFGSAKLRAPSIVFIDEIDAVGHKRVNSPFTPHANQTINQLLSEMDGFSTRDGVIVIGATNKKENLDRALLRPGRFDVEIGVAPPDIKGRRELFELYLQRVKCGKDMDLDRLAKLTFGNTGADISNVVNQAALQAVKENREEVIMADMLYALDKVSMGPERKGRTVNKDDKWSTAVHEAGHTIVALHTKHADPVNKVTVVPRGPALGFMQSLPQKDFTHSKTKAEMMASMDLCFGGRVAEEMFIGPEHISVGCSSDFERATGMADAMVRKVGMSEKLGFRVFDSSESLSDEQRALLDGEINRLLKESYERARKILEAHKDEHMRLVKALMQYETVDKNELSDIVSGKSIKR